MLTIKNKKALGQNLIYMVNCSFPEGTDDRWLIFSQNKERSRPNQEYDRSQRNVFIVKDV